jgi:uncharacterized DUF497 family protein
MDFADAETVFAGATFTFEDDRFDFGEQRFITLGMLEGMVVVVAHTEQDDEIRIISMRKGTKKSKESTSKASQTDWERLLMQEDEDIDMSDIPEVTEEQLA